MAYCPECGYERSDSDKHCVKCGLGFREGMASAVDDEITHGSVGSPRRLMPWIVAGLGAALLIMAVVYVAGDRSSETDQREPEKPAQTLNAAPSEESEHETALPITEPEKEEAWSFPTALERSGLSVGDVIEDAFVERVMGTFENTEDGLVETDAPADITLSIVCPEGAELESVTMMVRDSQWAPKLDTGDWVTVRITGVDSLMPEAFLAGEILSVRFDY